uniref:Uncharacterized protein n=1 Tax=Oryza sativa subsp. japonica TaxID=39947 RepID=Q6H4V5_ORYSJ|nr:hypothetical protein [Oryza sativa Japonica Group]
MTLQAQTYCPTYQNHRDLNDESSTGKPSGLGISHLGWRVTDGKGNPADENHMISAKEH